MYSFVGIALARLSPVHVGLIFYLYMDFFWVKDLHSVGVDSR